MFLYKGSLPFPRPIILGIQPLSLSAPEVVVNPTAWNILMTTPKYPDPSRLAILRTLPLLYRFKPFHWWVQWSLARKNSLYFMAELCDWEVLWEFFYVKSSPWNFSICCFGTRLPRLLGVKKKHVITTSLDSFSFGEGEFVYGILPRKTHHVFNHSFWEKMFETFSSKHPTAANESPNTSRNRSLQHFASIARSFESHGFCWLPHMETKHTLLQNQVPWCFTVSTGGFLLPYAIRWKQPSNSIIEVVSLLGAFEGTDPEVERDHPGLVVGWRWAEGSLAKREDSEFGW